MTFINEIPEHLIIAIGELGIKEIPGVKSNPRINKYLEAVNQIGDDEIAWCAAFVSFCLEESAIPSTRMPNAKSYLNWGYRIDLFRPGAIAIFDRGSEAWMGHVGFALDEHDDYIILLGGNQSNRVSIMPYPKERFITYRWHRLMLVR